MKKLFAILLLATAAAAPAQKISELPAITVTGTSIVPIVQSGSSGRTTAAAIVATGSLTYQPLDSDLTLLASGTLPNVSAGVWTSGTASGLTLSGATAFSGTLSVSGSARLDLSASTNSFPIRLPATASIQGIEWGNGIGVTIGYETAQKKMRITSTRIDLLALGSLGDAFIQMLNNGFDNANVFISRQGDANSSDRLIVPGHRFGLVSGFWNGSSTTEKYGVFQGSNDGTNGFVSVFADGSLSQPGFPFSWPPASGGTETTRFTVQGVDVLNLGVRNVGTGITFTGTGAAATINNLGGSGGVFSAAVGGTGQGTYTIGDILFASGTAALSKLSAVATGNALISSGTGAAPAWGKITSAHTTGLAVSGSNTDLTHVQGLTKGNATPVVSGTASPTSGIAFFGNEVQIVRLGSAQAYTDSVGFIAPTLVSTISVNLAAGSTSFPSLTRLSDNTTGLAIPSSQNVTISTNATERTRWSNSGFTIGAAGSPIASAIVGSASLDFGNLTPDSEETLTITVTGATTTSEVALNFSGSLEAGVVVKQARVSASNTVAVTLLNSGTAAVNPAAVTTRAIVFNH